MKLAIQIAFQRDTVVTALEVCIIVGVLLNIINQGGILLSAQFEQLNWIKLMLTFLVPYLVSAYSTTKAKLDFKPELIAPVDIVIECQTCGKNSLELKKGQTIPLCPNCLEQTDWKIKQV
jgi:hypothetical protein